MSEGRLRLERIREALACEECRRRRRAALLALGALVLVWMFDWLALR